MANQKIAICTRHKPHSRGLVKLLVDFANELLKGRLLLLRVRCLLGGARELSLDFPEGRSAVGQELLGDALESSAGTVSQKR